MCASTSFCHSKFKKFSICRDNGRLHLGENEFVTRMCEQNKTIPLSLETGNWLFLNAKFLLFGIFMTSMNRATSYTCCSQTFITHLKFLKKNYYIFFFEKILFRSFDGHKVDLSTCTCKLYCVQLCSVQLFETNFKKKLLKEKLFNKKKLLKLLKFSSLSDLFGVMMHLAL